MILREKVCDCVIDDSCVSELDSALFYTVILREEVCDYVIDNTCVCE